MNDQEKVIELYKSGTFLRDIAKKVFGVQSIDRVKTILRNHPESGYHPKRRRTKRVKYFFNEKFFEVIDTEEKAYFFGLIASDGYIKKVNHNPMAVGLELKSDDIQIVEAFRDALGDKNVPLIIRPKTKTSCEKAKVIFFSRKLANDLFERFGENKTFDLSDISKYVPVHLRKHYVRGVLDGDGCWTHDKGRHLILSFRGTDLMLKDIQNIVPEPMLFFKGKWKWASLQSKTNRSAIRMFYWLYSDATIYLDRKYLKAKCGITRRRVMKTPNIGGSPEEGHAETQVSDTGNKVVTTTKERLYETVA